MSRPSLQTDPMSPSATLDERVWLARRLGDANLLLAALLGAWWLLITALVVFNAPDAIRQTRLTSLTHYVDLGLVVLFVGAGLALRSGRLTRPFALRVADVVYSVGSCLAAVGHAASLDDAQPALPVFVLIATYALMVRATLVPAPPRRTAIIGLVGWLSGAAALATVDFVVVVPSRADPGPTIDVLLGALVVWGFVTVALTTKISKILHGLRRRVKEAEHLGQYVVESKIAEGGMGVVYRANHVLLRRPTALKLLKPELSDSRSVARFEREVRLTSQLRHPNTIAVHDFGQTPDGVFYFAMELLEGRDLQTLVARGGPIAHARALYLFRQAASALSEAHDRGLIHRDVKPSNIFISSAGPVKDWVKVLDFGLVRPAAEANDAKLSVDGALLGTPLYMSPEQISNPDAIDPRADLYSLGCTLYYALTGGPVFDSPSIVEICAAHLRDEPVPVSVRNPEVPRDVERLVMCLLQKDPDERYVNADELVEAIDSLSRQYPWSPRDSVNAWERDPTIHRGSEIPQGAKPSGVTVDLAARPFPQR